MSIAYPFFCTEMFYFNLRYLPSPAIHSIQVSFKKSETCFTKGHVGKYHCVFLFPTSPVAHAEVEHEMGYSQRDVVVLVI